MVGEKHFIVSMSVKSQGILSKVREKLRCLLKSVKNQGIMFSFRKALFKMINFDTLRVTHAARVVLAGGFCSFLLFAKLNQGQ